MAELRTTPHLLLEGVYVTEVWHEGELIASIYPSVEPGVRIVSKHPLVAEALPFDGAVGVVQVLVDFDQRKEFPWRSSS